jgi:hypothetical protein
VHVQLQLLRADPQVVTHSNTITIDVHGKAQVTVAPKSESSS